jgi:nudix-type nucleoside diphosphatase (YffH/AdpP family)
MAKIISKELLHSGWTKLFRIRALLPSGIETDREIGEHAHVAVVLPFNPETRTVLLVRQMRHGVLLTDAGDGLLLEAPAGEIDEGESAEDAARREVLEEVGVTVKDLIPLGRRTYPSPGRSTETNTLFLAPFSDQDRPAAGGGVKNEGEEMEVVELSVDELVDLADNGDLSCLKLFALAQVLKLRRPDLFGVR